jgi:serine/threonine-protein kinase PknG
VTGEILMCHGEPVSSTGFCDVCGERVVADRQTMATTVTSATSTLSSPTVGFTTMATGRRGFDGEPGGAAEFAQLPPLDMPDPAGALLVDPHYPEHRQFCGNPACHRPVGRGYQGQPPLTHGSCGHCGLDFDFSPKLKPGELLAGRYDIVGWLAHGGLGWVYLAKDTALGGIYVAIKGVINPTDAQARELAVVERDVLIRLQHENIVRISNFVHHQNPRDGKPDDYLVMDYVNGLTLRQMIKTSAELTVTHVVTYGRAILAALDYLHRERLLYCDMKPDNVIHGVRGIKVVDLGAARAINDHTSKQVGTKHYLPDPAELKEHGLSERSDIHTVGKTLRELLDAAQDAEASDLSFGVESLRRLLDRAVSGFHQRFRTVAEMAEQLDGVRRELLALQGQGPLPAPSQRFDSTPELLDSGLGAIPGLERWTATGPVSPVFDDGRPSPAEAASRLPIPWAEKENSGEESAALFLDTAYAAATPSRLLDKLNTFGRDSVDVEFARVRAYLVLGDLTHAVSALGTAERLLGTTVTTDWRVQWHHGLLALARGKTELAAAAFDRVYSALPGEDAPKLALGFCYEHLDAARSRQFYEAVWWRDHAQASAAFGLARLLLRGNGPECRRAAVSILDGVRPVSRHYDAAKIATVRIHAATLPCGPPGAADFAEANRRLPELYLDSGDEHGEFRERLTTVVREAELERALADGGDERRPRLELERCYRWLAGRARDVGEHGTLVDRANAVRPKTWI